MKTWSRKRITSEEFIFRAKKQHSNFYDYSLVEYGLASEKVKIICPIHGIFEQSTSIHLKGRGCQKCALGRAHTSTRGCKEDFISKANEIHNNKYNYEFVEYKNNKTPIIIVCPIHGSFEQVPAEHLRYKGCPNCRSSKGEKKINRFLIENQIDFIPQKKFDGCKGKKFRLPFDFYLPYHNLCIEYDGSQHFTGWNDNPESLKIIQEYDAIKTNYCNENNIKLIRVKYNDNIEETLSFLTT